MYAPLKRKPVKLFKEWIGREWRIKAVVYHDYGQHMLDSLKTGCMLQSSHIKREFICFISY